MNNEFFYSCLWSFQEEDGTPITTTPLSWYDVMILIVLLQVLFRVSAAQMIPTWLAEMVHLLTTFWPELQIGTSEKPYQILRDYLQLYQTVILELNHHFTFTGSSRKNHTPMTAGSNSRGRCPLSQQSLSSGLGTIFRDWL